MSAACAPATATRPAAEPRRRLLTIFIVTSNLIREGSVEGPLFPALTSRRSREPRTGRPWDAPSVAGWRLSERNLHGNEEEADSPAQVSVSGTLLHKGHEFGGDKSPARADRKS